MKQELTEEQSWQKAEYERVCKPLKPNNVVRKIIEWLGSKNVSEPWFRASASTIYLSCCATKTERTAWDKSSSELKQKCENHVRTKMHEVRNHIVQFYALHGVTGPFRLEFPKTAELPHSTAKGHYAAIFTDGEQHGSGSSESQDPALLGPASSLLSRMLASNHSGRTILVHPVVELIDPRTGMVDDRGLFSGGGEIAAAFAIGACIPHLYKHIDVRRTVDVSGPVLHSASSLIFLGSSVNNETLSAWRDEMLEDERWPKQAFLTAEIDGVGTITKVRGKNQKPYAYEVDRPRSHEIDHALVSHFRDKVTSQSVVAFQGISSPATAAAAQYLCDNRHAKALQKRLEIGPRDPVPCFELLLKVVLRNYVASHVEYADMEIHRDCADV